MWDKEKYTRLALEVNHRNEMRIPAKYVKAICEDNGIDNLKGCILELKITVIHLKDNSQINFG